MVDPELHDRAMHAGSVGLGGYRAQGGIFRPATPVSHRDDEYESLGFDILARMQGEHFWYLGRHRFLLRAVHQWLAANPPAVSERIVDLGGGCGGWISYLARDQRFQTSSLALADSSEHALRYAGTILSDKVERYQIDLMNLQFHENWDVAFLLDVLEHIPDQVTALKQIHNALAPGGLLFVTVPALQAFWTWNDDAVHHQRRYNRSDFHELADRTGFGLLDARYFMFFLSPLVVASRWASKGSHDPRMTEDQKAKLLAKTHATPSPVINAALTGIFACETPVGHHVRFPWGTSLLAVMRKPKT